MPAATVIYKKNLEDERRRQSAAVAQRASRRASESLDMDATDPETIRRDCCAVVSAHEKLVFAVDDVDPRSLADYFWYDEETDRFYTCAYRDGLINVPLCGCHRGVCMAFVAMVRSPFFDLLINATICLVAVSFTLHLIARPDMGRPSDDALAFFVVFVKYCSMAVFAGEMVAKIVAEGSRPLRYLTGPEAGINTFDGTIVILSFALMGGGGGAVVLPVLRLARLVKLLNRTPETRRVLSWASSSSARGCCRR